MEKDMKIMIVCGKERDMFFHVPLWAERISAAVKRHPEK
jgi:hypothetical protein